MANLTVSTFAEQLGEATRKQFAADLQPYKVAAHATLPLEMINGLCIVEHGLVMLTRQTETHRHILSLLTVNEIFGGESLVTHKPPFYTVSAITDSTLNFLSSQQLSDYLQNHADFSRVYLSFIVHRLQQLVISVQRLAFQDVKARLVAILLQLADTHGQVFGNTIQVSNVLSQNEWADLVGTAREVIYRTFKNLEEDGLIVKTRESITIVNRQFLQDIATIETK